MEAGSQAVPLFCSCSPHSSAIRAYRIKKETEEENFWYEKISKVSSDTTQVKK